MTTNKEDILTRRWIRSPALIIGTSWFSRLPSDLRLVLWSILEESYCTSILNMAMHLRSSLVIRLAAGASRTLRHVNNSTITTSTTTTIGSILGVRM